MARMRWLLLLAVTSGAAATLLPEAARAAVARADFNNDGFADLAVGSPVERVGGADAAGAVTVIYGSADGLVPPGIPGSVPAAQYFTQDTPGIPDGAEAFDRFGAAVLGGDLDGDGFDELVVGVPGEDFGTAASRRNQGAILIIRGSAAGLVTAPAAPSSSRCRRAFGRRPHEARSQACAVGSALASGDFNGDGNGDLAVGAPGTAIDQSAPTSSVWSPWHRTRVRCGSCSATGRRAASRRRTALEYHADYDVHVERSPGHRADQWRYGCGTRRRRLRR